MQWRIPVLERAAMKLFCFKSLKDQYGLIRVKRSNLCIHPHNSELLCQRDTYRFGILQVAKVKILDAE